MLTNVTFSADKAVLERARARAMEKNTTINQEFREWLQRYAAADSEQVLRDFDALMSRMTYAKAGRKFSRDEMNERG
jgi:superfamily I DNA/RNA helicase